ncbi:Nucleophile aminohydrolase [Gracilaria domingensis]|nr:Nucleophile aminohydrolase [Gracilaria domingensis]
MAGDASTPGYLNGDGFGLGWYSPHPSDVTPCVYRHARPAWNDPNLGSIAEKIYTHVLFAHVRAASPGLDVSETTCHPFRYGRLLWMHNGGLGNFAAVRRFLLPTLSDDAFDFAVSHGSSDTALCFAVFINLIRDPLAPCTPEKLRACMQETILTLQRAAHEVNATETSLLNFVVSDGESIVASRYVVSPNNPNAQAASLYYASGNNYQSDGSAPGNYVMVHTDRRPSLAIISSEPLTERRGDWVTVPTNCCIVITQSMHILLSPIGHTCTPFISRILDNLANPKLSHRPLNVSQSHFLDQVMLNPFVAHNKQFTSDSSKLNGPSSQTLERNFFYNDKFASQNNYGSTVRSTITLSGRSVICCDVMGWLLCCGTNDGSIHVWNVEDDVHTTTLRPGQSAVLAILADFEDGILVSASSASSITLYKFGSKEAFEQTLSVSCEGKGDVLTLAKLGKKIFAGFSDGKVRCVIEDISSSLDDLMMRTTSDFESSDQIATNSVNLSCIGYEFPRHYDGLTHNSYVFALTACLDGRLLCTGCGDGILRWWDVETEKCVQKRDDHAGAVLALDKYETSYGTILFSGSRDCSVKVWVWDGESGFICKRTLRKHNDEVVFLKVCSNKLISGSADGAVCVWCAETLALICQYKDDGLIAGAVSPEYNLLFTASSSSGVHVREVVSTEEQHHKNSLRMGHEAPNLKDFLEGSDSSFGTATRFTNKSVDSLQPFSNESVLGADGNGSLYGTSDRKSSDVIRTEVHDNQDGVETLVPGVSNEMILGPLSPHVGKGQNLKKKLTDMMQSGSLTKLYDSQDSSPSGSDDDHHNISARPKPSSKCMKVWTPRKLERRLMQDVLARFVSFATVSGSEERRESCWQGARYIASFLEGLGATVKFVSTSSPGNSRNGMIRTLPHLSNRSVMSASPVGSNPVVLAKFASASPCARTITLYGHYDVMPVNSSQWKTNPWTLTSVDGYLYGRGATDNKGPIIASLFAIKHLLEDSTDGLGINIVVVLQGEGEMANRGFRDCIKSHRHWFEGTSLILTSSSSWLGESNPCITYGLRGVIELLVTISGAARNLHAGVDGGAIFEPMSDLIAILSKMVDKSGSVCVPGFDADIRPFSESERASLQKVEFDMNEYQKGTGVHRFTSDDDMKLLESRWRKPSISITSIDSSNASGVFSVVPCQASAKLSIRFVPDQDPQKLLHAVEHFLQTQLKQRNSPNQIAISCANIGDWWLEDPSCEHFQIAARAIKSVWGVEPQYVCEGGSMPVFSFLSKTLDAPLLQVPLGQSSDGAHLPNERIRAINLFRGKEVLQKIIQEFAQTK